MRNFLVPSISGESSVIHTRDVIVTVTLNADGTTYEVLMDGTPFKPAQSRKWITEFIEGLLKNDFNQNK